MSDHSDNFDASARLDQLAYLGETVTYKPRGGGTRSIEAIVNRNPTEDFAPVPGGLAESIVIEVANDATIGIASSEWNAGDVVNLPINVGEAAKDVALTMLMDSGDSMCLYELRGTR